MFWSLYNLIKTRKICNKSIICDVIAFWLIDIENRNVESNELIKTMNVNNLNNLNNLIDIWYTKINIASNAICWYCEIFAILLIWKQIRNVELNLLLKLLKLNFSNNIVDDLIDILIDSYFFFYVNDVSTRLFLLILLLLIMTMFFCLNCLTKT